MDIYLRYTSRGVREEDLHRAFSPFGEVQYAAIVTHEATGEPIGIGIVQMASEEQAKIALANLPYLSVDGAPLILDESRTGVGRRTGLERRVGSRPPIERRTETRRPDLRVGLSVS